MTLLAGDLGGTKTLLALFDDGDAAAQAAFRKSTTPDLESMVTAFLAATMKDLHPR